MPQERSELNFNYEIGINFIMNNAILRPKLLRLHMNMLISQQANDQTWKARYICQCTTTHLLNIHCWCLDSTLFLIFQIKLPYTVVSPQTLLQSVHFFLSLLSVPLYSRPLGGVSLILLQGPNFFLYQFSADHVSIRSTLFNSTRVSL